MSAILSAKYINVCKRDQDTINSCAKHSIEALRSTLIEGIPDLNVPGIEPFVIKEVGKYVHIILMKRRQIFKAFNIKSIFL